MASRLRLVVVGAALILGGPVAPSASVDDPALAAPFESGLQAEAPVARPGPLRSELESGPTLPSAALRHRVKRRRVRFGDLRITTVRGSGALRAVRSSTVDRIQGGRTRARALESDHSARALTPLARSARLGGCDTWCTSVPPPPAPPHRLA